MRFVDRVAIVTGSTRGIGFATAQRLAREGARVVINARKQDEIDKAVASLRADGHEAIGVAANLTRAGTHEELVDAAVDAFGRVDHVVNNVGINALYGPLMEADEEAFRFTMANNSWPSVRLIQVAMEAGLAEHHGSVVNVSTIGARQVQPLVAVYSAAKAGLDLLTATLARELGPQGVRVNGVAPGLVKTVMSSVLWEGEKADAEASLLPLQRLGEPEDIANAIVFLLSPEASWITGVTIAVDGGRLTVGGEPRDLYGVYPEPGENGAGS
jgi:3-oxoacyl-[acyl-carrier protein] reductase